MSTHTEAVQKLNALIKGIRIAMLTTQAQDGALHSRPMGTIDAEFDGTLWFFTAWDSTKADELRQHPNVNVAYADPAHQRYVSVVGRAEMVRDDAKARELWNPMLKAWFPEGLEDPELALIRIDVDGAEYWDSPSGTAVVLAGFVKAALTGKRAQGGENEKLQL
ncbi:general stress protein 26 [Deinobacterium chartae]|uniref:General stress protein 26 n=1 Tax=Deinobacterium chartae TaxID=521158 RepID=A0A841I759_9DEIO|nr:pyridoxamine 5'-phosphate oxidase family protein [Deinobacterium chartae]MBB6100049.1 general stress protein 26 [Deinobacterium chartae]